MHGALRPYAKKNESLCLRNRSGGRAYIERSYTPPKFGCNARARSRAVVTQARHREVSASAVVQCVCVAHRTRQRNLYLLKVNALPQGVW